MMLLRMDWRYTAESSVGADTSLVKRDQVPPYYRHLGSSDSVRMLPNLRWSLLLRQGRGENKVESCPS
jgi:hypothetical protein